VFDVPAPEKVVESHGLKVGDILYSTWGYDQTQVTWYQVVGITTQGVKLQEIDGKYSDHSHSVPIPNQTTGPIMQKKVNNNGVKINSFMWAQKWQGHPVAVTPYGEGH
jgi:hypothetical protein